MGLHLCHSSLFCTVCEVDSWFSGLRFFLKKTLNHSFHHHSLFLWSLMFLRRSMCVFELISFFALILCGSWQVQHRACLILCTWHPHTPILFLVKIITTPHGQFSPLLCSLWLSVILWLCCYYNSSLNLFWNKSEARYKSPAKSECWACHRLHMRGLQLLLVKKKEHFPDLKPTVCVDTKSSDYCWHCCPTSQDTKHWLAQQEDRKGCGHTHTHTHTCAHTYPQC